MKRILALAFVAVLIAAAAFATLYRHAPDAMLAKTPTSNPGHFVPSDVALLANTDRPQLVELFHYG